MNFRRFEIDFFHRVAAHLTFFSLFIVYFEKSLNRARPNIRVPDTSFAKLALPLLPCVACLIKMLRVGPKSGMAIFFSLRPSTLFKWEISVCNQPISYFTHSGWAATQVEEENGRNQIKQHPRRHLKFGSLVSNTWVERYQIVKKLFLFFCLTRVWLSWRIGRGWAISKRWSPPRVNLLN